MPLPAAERIFNKGLAALADARPLQAVDHFLDAMQTEQRLRVRHPDMRYLSYYGLSLARANRAAHAAFEACDLAARHDPDNPLLLLNLGRVLLLAGRLPLALECFERGLRRAPDHTTLPFLSRSNSLNRRLGQLRESLRRRAEPTAVVERAG